MINWLFSRFLKTQPSAPEVPAESEPRLTVSLKEISGALIESGGLPHPQWELIGHELDRLYPDADPDQLWHSACLSWLNALAGSLGNQFEVFQSPNFLYLAERTGNEKKHIAQIAERAHRGIRDLYKGMAEKSGSGKRVLLLLDPDDYFRYIAHFYPDGIHPSSAGLFIYAGYMHIVLCERRYEGIDAILCHELTHHLLAHLNLPGWLTEGMAMLAQQRIVGDPADFALIEGESWVWTPESIQSYWSGQTFAQAGEESWLSYQLSGLLCREIFERYPRDAANFVNHTRAEDAGAAAAIEFLRVPLGEIAATVLGPGNWEPIGAMQPTGNPPFAQLGLAFELIRAGRITDAEVLWQAALQAAPEPDAKLEIFDDLASLAVNHDLPQFLAVSKQLCEEGLAIDPAYIPLRITQGALLLREGNYSAARNQLFPLLAEAGSDTAALYYFLALAAHHLGEVKDAREFLAKAIELAPAMSLRMEAEFAIEGAPAVFPLGEEFAED